MKSHRSGQVWQLLHFTGAAPCNSAAATDFFRIGRLLERDVWIIIIVLIIFSPSVFL